MGDYNGLDKPNTRNRLDTRHEILHEKLGQIVFEDEGWWRGEASIGNQTIEFSIPDDGNGVDDGLAEYFLTTAHNFEVLLQQAVLLMSSELNLPKSEVLSRFKPTELWGFWQDKNDRLFYLSFTDTQNAYALWRVQFNNDMPVYLGCDA